MLEPQSVLEEIFPAIAYYQDTWGGSIDRVRLSGFGTRHREFKEALETELRLPVGSIAYSENARSLSSPTSDMIGQNLEALVGWSFNDGA